MSDFKLLVEQLGEAPATFHYEASAGWWAEREGEPDGELCEVEKPFEIELVARRLSESLLLEGELKGRVGLECSRCGKRYPQALREAFRLLLEPAKGFESTDPEGRQALEQNGLCLGEELEAGWFRGPRIGLDDFFGELIALAMPIQPLCEESCPGVCPHCGQPRKHAEPGAAARSESAGQGSPEAECGCADEKIDSPFAVLAKLKGELGKR